MRTTCLALLASLTLAAPAQTGGWRFAWHKGQVLRYRIEHHTIVSEVVGGSKVETTSRLVLTKRWQVMEVDAQGIATLQLSLTAMRNEQTRPDGSTLLFDSDNPDQSTPELREQLAKFINQPLAVLRVDGQGKVIEVKQGSASRYESEPPFVLTLPAAAPEPGQAWERAYKITLDPPLGTGEQYEAVQKYVCTKVEDGAAVMSVTTAVKDPPAGGMEQVPLLPRQVEGTAVFDVRRGRMHSAQLRIDRELKGHQGEGSSYRFQSTYTEQVIEKD
jgi:hypothetical protein